MESMDHEQAMALLGLPVEAAPDDIEAKYAERRRLLERRWVTSHSQAEKRVLESQMRDLDAARDAALSQQGAPSAPAGSMVDFSAGTVLAERYVVRARLGFGPRSAVFRALDLTWGKDVALKVIAPQLLLVPGAAKRVVDAVKQTLTFAHSGIVNNYAAIEANGRVMIAMELFDGRTLADRDIPFAWAQPKTCDEILRVITQISTALIYAEKKTLHLNLTPRNVMLAADESVKLTDFKMNLAVPVLAGTLATHTDHLSFIAPEVQAFARLDAPDLASVDARADQFSVAALAYFLAAGVAPVTNRKSLSTLRPDLPAHFVAAVERALALAPEARFPTLSDFVAALEAPPRKGRNIPARIVATAAVLGFVGATVLGLQSANEKVLAPLVELLPGGNEMTSKRLQAEALKTRSASLRESLIEAQRRLQRRSMDARMTLATVEQLTNLPDNDAPTPSIADARRSVEMLEALADLVTPRVFNGPDVLNAYNLAGLGEDHLAQGRYDDAVSILTGVETVLSSKVRDLRQAELLIEQKFGVSVPLMAASELESSGVDTGLELKQAWLSMTEQRRRFAEAIEGGLVLIPTGTFAMGDQDGAGAQSELPVRKVAVPAFKIGRHEVTQREYAACVEAGGCNPVSNQQFQSVTEDLPVAGLSWLDAQKYVDWLRMKTGEDYRLPSEAEWEYAARAGSLASYPWGKQAGRGRANCLDCGSTWDGAGPAPVGSFAANGFGLFDMTGNVWEWTADCWYRDYTSAPAVATARDGGSSCEKRVLRGGSWDNAAWLARVSYRAFAPATTKHELYGFRIAKSVE